MKCKRKEIDYDCVKSVRVERERIASETEDKSPKVIIEYFRDRHVKRCLLIR
jgi:hypothetical protein